jgi:DNA-nicking Smr family endonuclease
LTWPGGDRGELSEWLSFSIQERKVSGMDEPHELPIDGVLDLHTFNPKDLGELVPDYLAACRERGILQVRIIHGKGVGNLRRSVHAMLARHPAVLSFTLDHPQYGGWGATLVLLRPPEPYKPGAVV